MNSKQTADDPGVNLKRAAVLSLLQVGSFGLLYAAMAVVVDPSAPLELGAVLFLAGFQSLLFIVLVMIIFAPLWVE